MPGPKTILTIIKKTIDRWIGILRHHHRDAAVCCQGLDSVEGGQIPHKTENTKENAKEERDMCGFYFRHEIFLSKGSFAGVKHDCPVDDASVLSGQVFEMERICLGVLLCSK